MILISSMGGCASTGFISWLAARAECNCPVNSEGLERPGPGANQLGLKHRIRPPFASDPQIPNGATIQRAIFIFDTPYNIIPSLFGRQIASGHAKAITGKKPSHHNDLTEFLRMQEDSFDFGTQFENWRNTSLKVSYPRLLIRYSKLWDYLPMILQFLNIDAAESLKFPEKRERKTSPSQLGQHNFYLLREIYSELDAEISSAPDLFII